MLTQSDLEAISNLIDTRLELKLEEKFSPIIKDIGILKKDTATLKKGVRKIRKDLKIVIRTYDREVTELKYKVSTIENHLGLSS
mgnify:CR=1 FL=1